MQQLRCAKKKGKRENEEEENKFYPVHTPERNLTVLNAYGGETTPTPISYEIAVNLTFGTVQFEMNHGGTCDTSEARRRSHGASPVSSCPRGLNCFSNGDTPTLLTGSQTALYAR